MALIYRILSPSGRSYIGQTKCSLEQRKRRHINTANNLLDKRFNTKIAKAIRKYRDQLQWEILIDNITDLAKLDQLEIYYIEFYDSYKNGYNLNKGGNGNKGWKHTPESKIKMKQHHRNISGSANPMFGKSVWKGRKHKPETIEKMRKSREKYLKGLATD